MAPGESALDRHPAIASSVVIARGPNCSDRRLAAYIAMRNGSTPAAGELRNFLGSSLPDYMLPSLFVKISALPLTTNGKIDRAALPEPTIENTLRDDDFVAPRSPIEKKLSDIVCTLLKLEQEGYVSSEWGVSDNNRKAKYYKLTRAGRKQLARETREWEETAAILARFFTPAKES